MARFFGFILSLFLIFFLTLPLAQGFLGFPVSIEKVQKLLLPIQNLLERKSQLKVPVPFSINTNCTHWLQTSGDAIIYRFGAEHASSSAHALRDCLQRDEAAALRNRIRQVVVAFPFSGERDRVQEPLFDIVDMLPNLELVRWPTMRRGQHARQALEDKQSDNDNSWIVKVDPDDQSDSFIECNSDTLKVGASYGTGGSGNGIDNLYYTLIQCPNVRSVSLSVSQGGCTIGDDPFSFAWRTSDRFPDLESLTLSGYNWEPRLSSWSERTRSRSAQAWKKAMDWSKLKRLDIDRPPNSFLEAFHGELSGLDSFTLRPKWGFWGDEDTLCSFYEYGRELRQNYTSFIAALPPLRELSISGMGELLNITAILQIHGARLEKFNVHEFERDCTYESGNKTWTRPFLTITEIEELNAAAPNLQSLTLDVYRDNNNWPTTTLNALSTFPNLSHLTIHFDLEDPHHRRYAKECMVNAASRDEYCMINELMLPLLNQSSAIQIFHSLRQQRQGASHSNSNNNDNSTINKQLKNLTIVAGDYGRQRGGGMRLPDHCEHPRPVRYDCWVEGDDEEEVCKGGMGINHIDGGYCGFDDLDDFLIEVYDNDNDGGDGFALSI